MMHYKKGKNVEEELTKESIPIEVLPERFLWMQVKGGTHVPNVANHAKSELAAGTYRAVVWTGTDAGVGKAISCAEIMKRDHELHQVTRICYRKVQEFWDPQQEGLEPIVAKRNIPCVHILQSLDPIDPNARGYQHPKALGGFWHDADVARKRPEGAQKTSKPRPNYFTGFKGNFTPVLAGTEQPKQAGKKKSKQNPKSTEKQKPKQASKQTPKPTLKQTPKQTPSKSKPQTQAQPQPEPEPKSLSAKITWADC